MNKLLDRILTHLYDIADLIATFALDFFDKFFSIPLINTIFNYIEDILDFSLKRIFDISDRIADSYFKLEKIVYRFFFKFIFYICYPKSLFIRIFQYSKIKSLKSDQKLSLSNKFLLIYKVSQDQLDFLTNFNILRKLVLKDLPVNTNLIIKNKTIRQIDFLDSQISTKIEIQSLDIEVISFKSCQYVEDIKFDDNQAVKFIFQDNQIKKIETKSTNLVKNFPSKFKLIQDSTIVDNLF